jgi:hypothetical protein
VIAAVCADEEGVRGAVVVPHVDGEARLVGISEVPGYKLRTGVEDNLVLPGGRLRPSRLRSECTEKESDKKSSAIAFHGMRL